ncbi:NADH-quinone oxidoreductase subunit C [bacterium]|nr:NADH-quinone oxidoreductase subunit C [bacterium]
MIDYNNWYPSKGAYEEGDRIKPKKWNEVPDEVTDGTEDNIVEYIKSEFSDLVISHHRFRGDRTVTIKKEGIHKVLQSLKEHPEFALNMLTDITAVDYLGQRPRFEIVYHLTNVNKSLRIRIKAEVPERSPEVETVTDLWLTADWLEREVFDMFGIKFKGHPDLRRILLYEEFSGHPLRKDYPWNKQQPRVKPIKPPAALPE